MNKQPQKLQYKWFKQLLKVVWEKMGDQRIGARFGGSELDMQLDKWNPEKLRS